MSKQIFWICAIVLVCLSAGYGYKQWKTSGNDTDGAVVCVQNCDTPEQKARFAAENRGDTPDSKREHKQETAAQQAAIDAGFPLGTSPVSSNDPSQNSQPLQPGQGYENNQVVPNVVAPGNKSVSDGRFSVGLPGTNDALDDTTGNRQIATAPVGLPLTDSQSVNASNDLPVGGSGAYQWYRQGNLTWRINTITGRSCIIYATTEEWQKKAVSSHGCGHSAS